MTEELKGLDADQYSAAWKRMVAEAKSKTTDI
jgi:hypothetical protein